MFFDKLEVCQEKKRKKPSGSTFTEFRRTHRCKSQQIVRFGQEDEARKLNDQIKEAKKAERQTGRFNRHVVKRI